MKDRKSLYLLIFALIMVTIAFTLISVWGYRFYFSKNGSHSLMANVPVVKKTNRKPVQQMLIDSVSQQLHNPADTIAYDSSDYELSLKIREFNRINNEIVLALRKRISVKDSATQTTVAVLQKKIDELQNQNTEITKENAHLNETIKELLEKKQTENGLKSTSDKNKEQPASSLPLLVSHLRFAAYNNGKKTWLASETTRLAGSFEINVKAKNRTTEIYIVIVRPDGQLLFNASGTAATFPTNSGKKVYTAVVPFDNAKDNHKRLHFSVNSEAFNKGKYKMQIYHQGIMIGRLETTLY